MARTANTLNSYTGGAGAAYLTGSGIGASDTTITITGTTAGWVPLGTAGGWYLDIDYGTANEEKVYVASGTYSWASGLVTISGITRGIDETAAVVHSGGGMPNGVVCTPALTSIDTNEANTLVSQTLGSVTTTSGLTLASNGTSLVYSPYLQLTQVNTVTSGTINANVGDIINLISWAFNTTTVNLPANPRIGNCILVNIENSQYMTINFTPQSNQSINGNSNGTSLTIPYQSPPITSTAQVLFIASSATAWTAIAAGTDLGAGVNFYNLAATSLNIDGYLYANGALNIHNVVVSGNYTSGDQDLWVQVSGTSSPTIYMVNSQYHDVVKFVSNMGTGTVTVVASGGGYITGTNSLPPNSSAFYVCTMSGWDTLASYGTNLNIPGGTTNSGSLAVWPQTAYNVSASSGTFSVGGTIGFSDVNNLASFVASGNNYNQVTVQNTTSGTTASTSFVANNNLATSGNYYAEFGINSNAFSGTGVFNTPNAGYLAVASGELGIGTYNGGGVHIVVSGNSYDSIVVSGNGTISISGTVNYNQSTIQNARIQKRVLVISGSSSGTPSYNTNNYDVLHIEYQTAAITSFTTSGTGSPVDGDMFRISVMSTVSGIPLTFGTNFESSTVALPTTTISGVRLDMGFFWNTETSKWRCVAEA